MSEFFHGWRRKAGCVTLVMASAICGVWTRSLYVCDRFWIPSHFLGSGGGCAWWMRMPPGNRWSWESKESDRVLSLSPAAHWNFGWDHWSVPYWSIVLLIVLLSAYLIVWPGKQPERKLKAPVEDK